MPRPKPETFDKKKIVAENRRARFDYSIEEKFEAGLALQGTEVKALRAGEATIAESYAEVRDGEVWLINANIPEYSHGNRLNHETKRPRKLLLNSREINKLFGAVERKGMTLVPLSIYFNSTGRAKVELALAKGNLRFGRFTLNASRLPAEPASVRSMNCRARRTRPSLA